MLVRIERISGVCPLIIHPCNPNLFLGVQELDWKRATNKLAGMWSPGFETVEDGESHTEAIRRFFKEEVSVQQGQVIIPEDLGQTKLCLVQLSEGIWLHTYRCFASEDLVVWRGTEKDEVEEPAWININEVLGREERRFTFRPATREILEDYKASLENPETFRVRIYEALLNGVPPRVFDLLEAGFNQNEALSRLGFAPQLLLRREALTR